MGKSIFNTHLLDDIWAWQPCKQSQFTWYARYIGILQNNHSKAWKTRIQDLEIVNCNTCSLFYKGQAIWEDIKNSKKIVGQLISKLKNGWDSEKVGAIELGCFFQL